MSAQNSTPADAIVLVVADPTGGHTHTLRQMSSLKTTSRPHRTLERSKPAPFESGVGSEILEHPLQAVVLASVVAAALGLLGRRARRAPRATAA